MARFTITDAAKKLGVSKEAIHNRVRRGSLNSVVENGIKYVIIEAQVISKASNRTSAKKQALHVEDRYHKLLQEQNEKLQQRVDTLENETRSLRDQKEQMLIDEREKIEQIYKQKDEQLKNILNAISSKFMLNAPDEDIEDVENIVEVELEEEDKPQSNLISLNKYLKQKDISKKKAQKIKDRFKKHAKNDSRIIKVGNKFYIDLEKYDYSDYSL